MIATQKPSRFYKQPLFWWIAGFTLLGALLRLPGLFTELWLDEVWSVLMAQKAQSIAALFTDPQFQYDNNHWLNTIWLWLVKPVDEPWAYRLLSFVTGVAVIPVSTLLVRTRAEKLVALVLFTFCYQLVHYSSEARGYMPALLFTLCAIVAINRYADYPRLSRAVWFWIWCILAMLSHLTFLYAYGAIALWSIVRIGKNRTDRSETFRSLLICHAVPAMAWMILWMVSGRYLVVAGGDYATVADVLGGYLHELLGIRVQSQNIWYVAGALLYCLLFVAFNKRYQVEVDSALWRWVVILPLLLVKITEPPVVYPRYFLLVTPFLLIPLAILLGETFDRRKWRAAAVVIILPFVVGSVVSASRISRGNYEVLVRYMATEDPNDVIRYTSDSPFRHGIMIEYYGQRVAPGRRFEERSPDETTDWILEHDFQDRVWRNWHHTSRNKYKQRFRRIDETECYSGYSGFSTYLYKRMKLSKRPAIDAADEIPLENKEQDEDGNQADADGRHGE